MSAASTIVAAPTPISVERQPRTTPTPRTIVSASTISTALARKAPRIRRAVLVLTSRLSCAPTGTVASNAPHAHDRAMSTSQSGIFALGTASHAYLEFDARQEGAADELVRAIASLREPRTTMGGVNLVAGFRPELWREVVPDDAPPELEGFNRDLVGADGYTMPATQHDAVLWLSGSAYDVIFETAREALATLAA